MSKKITKGLTILALAILSLGAIFLMPSLLSWGRSPQVSAEDKIQNSDNAIVWTEIELNDANIVTATHYGLSCMEIDTAEDLALFSYEVNRGTADYVNANVYLAGDIDLSAGLWTPIGTNTNPFQGNFFGNGFAISNIVIAQASQYASTDIGLFGAIRGGSIVDLTVSGAFAVSSIIDSSTTVGTLVGRVSGGASIVNCFDQTMQPTNTTYKTIGNAEAGTYVIYPSSKNGQEVSLTTKEEMTNAITIATDSSTKGYSAFFNTGVTPVSSDLEGTGVGFYRSGKYFFSGSQKDSQQIRVAYTDTDYATVLTGFTNVLYASKAPVLRNAVSGSDVYVLRTGYQATIASPTVANSGIVNITWQTATVNVTYEFGYGSRSVSFTTGYDTPWANIIAERPIERLGYQSRALYSNVDKTIALNTTTISNVASYYANNKDVVYMTWSNPKTLTSKLYFAAASGEGGAFNNNNGADAVSGVSVTGATSASDGGDDFDLTAITAGDTVTVTFTLNAGYTFQGAGVGQCVKTKGNWTNVGQSSLTAGAYAYFPNSTGKGTDYTVRTSGGYYDAYTPVAVKVSVTGDRYTVTFTNILDNGGELALIFGRAQKTINITGTNVDKAEATLSNNSTQTSVNQSNKTLTTKVGEIFTLTVNIPDANKDFYILGYKFENIAFDNVTSTRSTILNGNTYYSNRIFEETNGFEYSVSDMSINLTINRLVTYITVQIGENGSWYADNSIADKYQVPVYITNSTFEGTQSTLTKKTFEVSNATATTIRLGQESQTFFNLKSVSGVSASISNNSITYIFENRTGDADSPAYTITIIPEKILYDVTISYTLDGQPIEQEVAQRFLSFSGKTQNLDYANASGYAYTIGLTTGAQTWLNYNVSASLSNAGFEITGISSPATIQGASNNVWSGTFGSSNNATFTYKPGSTDSTITIALTTKTINVKFAGLVLNSDPKKTPFTSTNYANLTLKYSADGLGTLTLSSGNFTEISIENGYYLVGWYLSNGKVINTFSNAELVANSDFTALVEASAKGNQPTPKVTINPLVEARVVNLSYSANGENADQGVSEDRGITAPTYTYGQDPVALSTTKYKKIGYSFNTWNAQVGTVNNGTYQLTGTAWNAFWSSGTSTSSWNSFVTSPESDTRAQKQVVLTASFSILTYKISIDGTTTLNIQLGQTVNFAPAPDKTYATYSVGATSVNGTSKEGYEVTSFTLAGNKADTTTTTGLTTFELTLDNIQSYISADNLYTVSPSDSAHLTISTEFTAMVLKLYITTSSRNYYTVALSGDMPEGAGGTDSTGTYVNISYGQLPSEVLSYVTVTREGFNHIGYTVAGVDFAVGSAYNQTTNSTLMPKFEFDEDAEIWTDAFSIVYSSKFNTENLQTHNRNEFYMENPLDSLGTGLFGLASSSTNISNAGVIFSATGDVTSYLKGYESYRGLHQLPGTGEEADLLDTFAVYVSALAGPIVLGNITNLDNLSVVFEIRLEDSIEFGVSYTITIETTQFKILKNETVTTVADQIESYYTGSSDILISNNENANGSGVLGFKYDANGNITNETVLTFQFDQEDSMNLVSNIAILDDFAVGTHNIMLTLRSGETYPGLFTRGMDAETFILILKLVVSNTSSTDDSVFFTFTDAVDVVKTPAVIGFTSGGSAYVDGMVITVDQNGNGAFNALDNSSYPFTYKYDSITLKNRTFDSLPKTFTGTENATTDQAVFEISNLVIQKGGTGENLLANFDWTISTDSSFVVFNSDDFVEYRYEARYFTANEQGTALLSMQSEWNGNRVHNFTVSNIMVNGESVSPNNNGTFTSQYNHLKDGQLLFTIIGNGENVLVVSVNPSTVTSLSMDITVGANQSTNVDGLILYNWQAGTTVDESLFGNVNASPVAKLDYAQGSGATNYAVFTDTAKVVIDFNLDSIADQTLYVANNDSFAINNPTDSASELSFAGYQTSGSGIQITDNKPTNTYTIAKSSNGAGGSATLTAKWTLSNVSISQTLTGLTIGTMSEIDNQIDIDKILSITSERFDITASNTVVTKTTGVGAETEALPVTVNGGNAPKFLLPYTMEHNETYLSMNNAGQYKISVTFSYDDGVQEPTTITKDFTVTVTMQKSTIVVGNIATANDLTFANKDFQDVEIPLTYNITTADSLENLTSQPVDATITEQTWATKKNIFFNDDPIEQVNTNPMEFYIVVKTDSGLDNLYQAGAYTFDFVVLDNFKDYIEIVKPQQAEELVLTIDKFEIMLKDYSSQITVGKPAGVNDPNPITSQITISATNNDRVDIYFDRADASNDAIASYDLSLKNDSATYFNGLSQADSLNYTVNMEGFTGKFTIYDNTEGELALSLPNDLHYTYTGQAFPGITVALSGNQLIVKVTGTEISAELKAQIKIGDNLYDIAENYKQTIVDHITIQLQDQSAGAVNYKEDGYGLVIGSSTGVGFDTVNLNGKLYIDKAPITLTEVSKTFDKTNTFKSATINFNGALNGDSLKITGNFASEHAGSQALESLAITGTNSNNYYISNPDFMGTITAKAVSVATVTDIATDSLTYGQIVQDISLEDLLALLGNIQISIDGETVTLVGGQADYISISSFEITSAVYSTSNSLVANSSPYTIKFVLASSNYTGMNGTENGISSSITVNAKVLDLSATTISKGYDGTTALPSQITWNGLDIIDGDDVSVDMIKSVFASKDKGSQKVTVVLSGKDNANYAVTDNINGEISAITITLQVDTTENLPEGGFVDGDQTITNSNLEIRVSYPFDKDANVADIISAWAKPSRVGYTVTGYSYKQDASYIAITSENLASWLETIATDALNTNKSATIYPNWQINTITITITGQNLDSISASPDGEVSIVDGNFDDNSATVRVDYYSTFALTFTTDRGYKITGVKVGNSAQSERLGLNTFTANFSQVSASTEVQITTSSIVVTFNINKNIPVVDGAYIVETSSTGERLAISYADLTTETLQATLPAITLTEGTFTLSGWKNGEADLVLTGSVKDYIDSLFTTLDADKTVDLTAQWQGVEYTITFDGGELEIDGELVEGQIVGTSPIKATFGQSISETFPTATLKDGYVYNFYDETEGGKLYTQGTVLSSIRENRQLTLYAIWSAGNWQVTFEIAPQITVRYQGENLSAGSREITYGETWEFEIIAQAGYSFTVNVDEFHGRHSALTVSPFSIWDVTANSTIVFEAIAQDNTLTLSYNTEHISVTVDSTEYTDPVTKKTGTTATIVATANQGYEFTRSSAVLSGSGSITGVSLTEENTVLSFTWQGFTDDATITIFDSPASIDLSWGTLSTYASSLSINGSSLVIDNGSFSAKTGDELNIEITLKYGYENAKLTSQNATISNENNSSLNENRVVVYTAKVLGFTSDFSIELTADARKYTVTTTTNGLGADACTASVSPSGEGNLVFGYSVTLKAEVSDNTYRFIGWYQGDNLISEQAEYQLNANLENKTLLESGNLEFEARFDYNTVDVTFTSSLHGSMIVRINEEEPFAVGAGSSIEETVFVGDELTFTFVADAGYEIDLFNLDEDEVSATEIDENSYTYSVTANGYSTFTINYKASEVYVDISVSLRLNFVNYPNNYIGGKIYLVDERGTKLEDTNYLEPTEGDKEIGGNYKVLTYTDQVFYLMAETNPGYSFAFDSQSSATIDTLNVDGKTIYRISNATDGSKLTGVFTAEEQRVSIEFVTDLESGASVTAGRIRVTENSVPTTIEGNNSDKVSLVTITGSNITLTFNTNFYYKLVADEVTGNATIKIDGDEAGFTSTAGTVENLGEEEILRTGFISRTTLTLSGINADITIKILVESIEYNVAFYIDENDALLEPVVINNVVYGQNLNIDNLSDVERERLTTSRLGYKFLGYFTKQLGQGTQYFNELLGVVKVWSESPYRYNGEVYVVEDNYNPETNTFTLYAGWSFEKAIVSIDFVPPQLKDIDQHTISDVVTSISQSAVWFNPEDVWYAEFDVSTPVSLSLSAIEYEGYQFAYWSVESAEGTVQYNSKNITIDNIVDGEYAIQAVYRPIFTIKIESDGQEENSLIGDAYLTQDGQRVEGDSFDSTKEIVLVAEEKPGYSFLYWLGEDGTIYYASETSAGKWTYSLGSQVEPLNLTAVFEGDEVDLAIDTSQFVAGQIISLKVGDEDITDFAGSYKVKIGEKIELTIQIDNGYGVAFEGPSLAYDPTTNTYTYIAKASNLVDGTITIKPVTTREEISFEFEFRVGGQSQIEDATMTGSTRFTYTLNNQISANTIVTDESLIEGLLFGGTATLTIIPSTNYAVGNILIYSTNSYIQDITALFSNGTIQIANSVLSEHFSKGQSYKVVINFVRMIWSEEQYIASSLQGEGTEQSPYIIAQPADMGFVAWAVNNAQTNDNNVSYADCYYRVTADIDFSGKYWEPIGTTANPFNGVMDLGSHSISNITFADDYTNPTPSYSGLFWILGEDAVVIQSNNVLAIVLGVIGGLILLAIIIIIIVLVVRKKKKKRYHELVNG